MSHQTPRSTQHIKRVNHHGGLPPGEATLCAQTWDTGGPLEDGSTEEGPAPLGGVGEGS